jgi:nucleotide-binding universal stress UspA family protein
MNKILVPTDFSPHADAAFDYAIQLAQKQPGEVILLHVLHTPVNWAKLSKDQERLFPETQESIRKARAALAERVDKAKTKGITVGEQLCFSDGKDQILSFVEREHASMVVMGSHGQYGWKEHMLGSNTYHVLRKARVPVLVVKNIEDPVSFNRIVFATDLKENSGKALKQVEEFAAKMGLYLHLLYVNTPANFLEDSQIEQLAGEFLEKYADSDYPVHHYSAYKEERGIIQFAEKLGADMVAVATHGRSDLQQLFAPSVTENLVTYLKVPVWSINLGLVGDASTAGK